MMMKNLGMLFCALLVGCADPQIGHKSYYGTYIYSEDEPPTLDEAHAGRPIRRVLVHEKGDPIIVTRDGHTLYSAKMDLYFDYVDVDNDGSFTSGDQRVSLIGPVQ